MCTCMHTLLKSKFCGILYYLSPPSPPLPSHLHTPQLKEEQIQRLYVSLGIDSEEGLGLAYHALVPYIMQALEQ